MEAPPASHDEDERDGASPGPDHPGRPFLSRRFDRRRLLRAALLAAGGASASSLAAVLYALYVEPHWLELVEHDLPVEGLPAGLAGRTLALLTDLHVGPQVDDGYLLSTFERVAQRRPDIVAVVGDWVSYQSARQVRQLRRVLRQLPQGRLATVGVLGNHDYGHGWRELAVADAIERTARDAGVLLLRNQAVEVDGLALLGLDDFWSPCFGPARLLAAHRDASAVVVLCHNPDVADQPVWSGVRGWMLCGHTHGGQCKPPFLPPPLLPVRNRRYVAGEIRLADRRRLYISRGVGHVLQARFNVRPEVTLFRLLAAT